MKKRMKSVITVKWLGVSCIYIDVDLKPYNLSSVPMIFCSLEGNKNHWEAIGVNSIYRLSPTGFRVYLYYRNGISPQMAKSWGWRLAWIAFLMPQK